MLLILVLASIIEYQLVCITSISQYYYHIVRLLLLVLAGPAPRGIMV